MFCWISWHFSTGGVLTDAPDKYPHPWRCPEGDAVQGEPETRTRSAAHNLLEWWFQAVETREEGEGDRKLQSPWGFFEDLCGMQLKIVPPGDGAGGYNICIQVPVWVIWGLSPGILTQGAYGSQRAEAQQISIVLEKSQSQQSRGTLRKALGVGCQQYAQNCPSQMHWN